MTDESPRVQWVKKALPSIDTTKTCNTRDYTIGQYKMDITPVQQEYIYVSYALHHYIY